MKRNEIYSIYVYALYRARSRNGCTGETTNHLHILNIRIEYFEFEADHFAIVCLMDCVAFNHFSMSASSLIIMMTRKLIKLTSLKYTQYYIRNATSIFWNSSRISFILQLLTFLSLLSARH